MARKKKPAARKSKKKTPKRFRFQLGLAGVAGIAVVAFCLFLWMFLLGIWAGQTILLPSAPSGKLKAPHAVPADRSLIKILKPDGKKSPVTPKNSLFRNKPDGIELLSC
jgi:hypothetical protein